MSKIYSKIKEVFITEIGDVLVKEVYVDDEVWSKLKHTYNPFTNEPFESSSKTIEVPLNDFAFKNEEDFENFGFIREIIDEALEEVELLWFKNKKDGIFSLADKEATETTHQN